MTIIRTLGLLVLFTILGSTAHAHKSEPFLARAAATELMQVMKMDKLMAQSTATMVDGMMARLPPQARQRDKLIAFFSKHVGWESLKNDFIKNYVEAFTSAELRELVTFYKTPTGQKALQTIPSLMQKSAKKGQERVQAALPELLKELGVQQ